MKKVLLWLPVLALAMFTFQCAQEAPKTEEKVAATVESEEDLVKRGEYLVTTGGCEDCHSPKMMTDKGPVPDPKLRMSGHPAGVKLAPISDPKMVGPWVLFHPMSTASVGPWGTSFSANLTPHETGIKEWSFEQFKRALTEGKSKGLETGRPLLPPMPWPNYINMKEEDLKAIFAFLKSLPPVDNLVPAPIPPVQ